MMRISRGSEKRLEVAESAIEVPYERCGVLVNESLPTGAV
jgi:hypothetical protein